jgi:microcystin-dependent protein
MNRTPDLLITNYKGRAVIAFDVSEALVSIIGIFYGGQDYENTLGLPDRDINSP